MSQPSTLWWQKYGTLAQMAQTTAALLGLVATLFQIMKSASTTSVTLPDCKLGKT